MIIYLIRHGQSLGNVLGDKYSIIKGSKDNSSLTSKGKKQIKKIALEFKNKNIKIDKIFSSPLKRAYQSALIFKRIFSNAQVIKDEKLTEINFGELERKNWQEVKNKYSLWLNQYLNDRFNTPFPDGESRKDLCQRVEIFIQNLKKIKDAKLILFTHEEVIRAFLSVVTKNKTYFFDRKKLPKIDNASVTSIWLNKEKFVFQLSEETPFELDEKNIKEIYAFLKRNAINPLFATRKKSYSDNLVFKLTTSNEQEHTLKLIPLYKEKQVKKEIFLCNYFKRINFPTPECFVIKKGSQYIFHLRRYIDDKLGSEFIKDKKYQDKLAGFMGETLNKIHISTKSLKQEERFIKLSQVFNQQTWKNNFLNNWLKKDLETLFQIKYPQLDLIRNLYEKYLKIKDFPMNEGFIYYDFHPQNLTVKLENNQFTLTGIWDFENAFWGDVFFDIAYTIKLSFYKNQKLISRFLESYFSKNIKKEEKSLIFFYLLIIVTGSITYKKERRIDYFEEIKNLDWFLKKYLKLVAND